MSKIPPPARPLLLAFALLALAGGAGCARDGAESASPAPAESPAPPLPEAPTEAHELPVAPADSARADSANASTVR